MINCRNDSADVRSSLVVSRYCLQVTANNPNNAHIKKEVTDPYDETLSHVRRHFSVHVTSSKCHP